MGENFITREAIFTDIAAIMAIEKQSFGEDSFSVRQFRYLIGKAKSNFYIVADGGKVIAYICLLEHEKRSNLRIYSVAVDQQYRGRQLGQKLINKTLEVAKNKQLNHITLEVKINNQPAINLYQKNGFKMVKVLDNYYHDGAAAYYMKLNLK